MSDLIKNYNKKHTLAEEKFFSLTWCKYPRERKLLDLIYKIILMLFARMIKIVFEKQLMYSIN